MSLALVLALGPGVPGAEGQEREARLLEFDDLLRLEGLGMDLGGPPVAFSPGGEHMAFVRLLSTMDASRHDQRYLRSNHRGDIWVSSTRGGEPVRITPGESDGFRYWAPLWAPDGERLVLLSNRDDEVRLYLWDRATGEITRRIGTPNPLRARDRR